MKVSLNWIRDYVDLPDDICPDKLSYDLTMTTVEVEGYQIQSDSFQHMVVGKVVELKAHPNADRLAIAMTAVEGGDIKEIVCGGSNLTPGQLVAVAAPGARVRWHGEGDLVELGEAKIRGVRSYGMICAANEIGLADLFPLKDAKEILDLSHLEIEAGTPLASALGLNDTIFDIDNKSLTNRPDLWGHYGIAREIAAIYSLPLKSLPDFDLTADNQELTVEVAAPDLCHRYIGTLVRDVSNPPSPLWMQTRLMNVGQRPIDLLVDLTNYVMFALGQPTHVFDLRTVPDATIYVRRAQPDETLTLLDDSVVELSEEMLVIADKNEASALGGIMGGKSSGVSADTSAFILEVAKFEPVQIRRTASRIGARTEGSMRHEKGIDAERVETTTKLFLSLLKEVQPAAQIACCTDQYPTPQKPVEVVVDRTFINARIGLELSTDAIVDLLSRLGLAVDAANDSFTVDVPAWRATGDISLPEDIVEEVARLYGYDNLDFVAPPVTLVNAVKQPRYELERRLKEHLAHTCGMHEIFSYPWVEEKYWKAARLPVENALALHDAPSPTSRYLQTSLIPHMLAGVERNLKYFCEFGLFELARTYTGDSSAAWSVDHEKLPVQPKMLSAVVTDSSAQTAFLKLKGILTSLFTSLPMETPEFAVTTELPAWSAKGAGLSIVLRSEVIGHLAVVAPATINKLGLERIYLAAFELNASNLIPLSATHYDFSSLPKYPVVHYDLALIFDDNTPWQEIHTLVAKTDPLIKSVQFVDEYRGEQIDSGKKSLAFQITLADESATLTSEEVQEVIDQVLNRVNSKLGGTLRDR